MAVIRQQRQNISRSIGVVRADTGEVASWRSVGELADNMIQDSFNELKKQAKERGIETAQAASAADLRSIDPETGEPVAFQLPNNFGRAAQDAYKEIIERRYVAQTEDDFKQKAAELSQTHKYKPNGSALFDADFGNFVQETSKNAAPRFANIINQVGSSLQASYRLNLTAEEAQRERVSAANAVISDVEQSAKTMASLHSSPSFQEGSDSFQSAQILLEDRLDQIDKAQLAFPDLITKTKATELKSALTQAIFDGTAQRIIAKIESDPQATSLQVNDIRRVVQSGGAGIDDLPDNIREDIRSLINSPDFIDNKKSLNTSLTNYQTQLGNAETQARLNESDADKAAREQEAIDAENARLGIDRITKTANDKILDAITNNDLPQSIFILRNLEKDLAGKATTIGSSDGTNRAFTRARHLFQDRISDQINNKTDYKEAALVERYINQEGKLDVDLPDDIKNLADTIISTADYSRDRLNITRLFNSVTAEKKAILDANTLSESDAKNLTEVSTGTANPASAKSQETMEKAITGSDRDPNFFFQNGFNERFNWGQTSASRRVLPKSLVSAMNNMIDANPYNDRETQMLAEYYAQFADVRLPNSTESINLFDLAGMNGEQIGLIEGALYAASFEPDGIASFKRVLDELREARNDPQKFAKQIKSTLKDQSIEQFADEITLVDNAGLFTGDTANPNASFEMMPFIEYQIASGKPIDQIKSDTRRYFEQHYHKLQGIVIDPAFQVSDRSRQALSGRFGDKVPDVVGLLNNQLRNVYGVSDAVFELDYGRGETDDPTLSIKGGLAMSQSIEEEMAAGEETPLGVDRVLAKKRLRLMPLPFSGTTSEDLRYMVIEIDDEGKPSPFIALQDGDEPTFIYFSLNQLSEELANAADL